MNNRLTLPFTHAGQTRTLAKHPRVQQALRTGTITLEAAAATPWYLRAKVAGQERSFKLTPQEKTSIASAKDILNGHQTNPQQFSAWLAEKELRRGVTLGQLAAQWLADGCPFDGEAARTPKAAAHLREILERALPFWSGRRPAAVTHALMAEFVTWRRNHCRPGATGTRTADLELAALSCLCSWAHLTDRIEKNPFATRKRFQRQEDITHCHDRMPDDDQQLHRILSVLFQAQVLPTAKEPDRSTTPDLPKVISGAYLAFTALSGLRPGEPEFLRRVPAATEFPTNLATAADGLIYPMPDGTRRMKVHRLKRGQNPAIILHPALADFLAHYLAWLDVHQPLGDDPRLFPVKQDAVAGRLERVCRELELPALKPHGFGRAYYVRVRRSQGEADPKIAVELGQTSQGNLIRTTYGDPLDPVGGNLHDWLPAAKNEQGQLVATPPAWTVLREALPANLVMVKF